MSIEPFYAEREPDGAITITQRGGTVRLSVAYMEDMARWFSKSDGFYDPMGLTGPATKPFRTEAEVKRNG